jgi:hypothetical protein
MQGFSPKGQGQEEGKDGVLQRTRDRAKEAADAKDL